MSQNLKNGNLEAFIVMHYSSSCFITYKSPSGTKSITESESHQMAKHFLLLLLLLLLLLPLLLLLLLLLLLFFFLFFFSSSSFSFFRQSTSNLRDSFTSNWRTMVSFIIPFSSIICMCPKHLAAKCNYILFKVAEFEMRLVCMELWRLGEALSSIVDSVKRCLVSIFSANIAYIY